MGSPAGMGSGGVEVIGASGSSERALFTGLGFSRDLGEVKAAMFERRHRSEAKCTMSRTEAPASEDACQQPQ